MDPITAVLIVVAAALFLYHQVSRGSRYFDAAGVECEKRLPFFGNMAPVIFRRASLSGHLQDLYNKFSHVRYFGFYRYSEPIYVIRDPALINSIAVKSFDNFTDHQSMVDEDMDPLMARNLFSLKGDHWREVRKTLSPAFTSSKMRMMFQLIGKCAENLGEHLREETAGGAVINMKDILARYANDVVASCAFGVSVNSVKDPKNEFYTFGRKTLNFESNLSLKFLLGSVFKSLSKAFQLRMFPREVTDFFLKLVDETVKARRRQGIVRPDMIQLMMDTSLEMSTMEMTSQAFVFFFAGFDATSTFMGFLTHELAVNEDAQRQLHQEIQDVLATTNGRPSYEDIGRMKYLDAVVNETLRLYPLASNLDRVCVKEFQLPPAAPGGKPVTVRPGDAVWFPTAALHRDPKYFPEPDSFRPRRFLDKEVDNSVYMPFGVGPRICIGNRFALMVGKVMIFHLLANCRLERCERTMHPMRISRRTFIMLPENGFWLRLRPREKVSVS